MNAIAPQPKDEVAIQIPLTHLRDSPFQKERVSKRGNLDELAASMKEVGVLEPLIARPGDTDKNGEDLYELAAGHRRKRAAAIAGLTHVPCIVREYSDDQMLEVCAAENGHRTDLHPLDEADLLVEYRKRHPDWPLQQLADKVGRSPSHVAQRLQLQHLGKEARAALDEDRLLLGVALQLARVPSKLQAEALTVLERNGGHGAVMTSDAAAKLIRDRFMLRLVQAPFDRASAELVPKAGACITCPKRTGNQVELFSDVDSPDLCTDPGCHRSKMDAYWKLTAKATAADGGKVLSDAESKKVFNDWSHERVSYGSKLQSLDAEVHVPGKGHVKVKTLLKGKDVEITLARNPHSGQIHQLVSASTVEKAAREADGSKSGGKGGDKGKGSTKAPKLSPAQKAKAERDKLKAQAKLLVLERCIAKIGERVEKLGAKADNILLEVVAAKFCDLGDEGLARALERRGVKPKNSSSHEVGVAARKYLDGANENATRALFVEVLLAGELDYMLPYEEKQLAALCKDLKIDRAAVEKEVVAELKAAKDAKPGKRGVCSGCGCTDPKPCKTDHGPCCWVDKTETLCSGCAP